MIEHDIPRERDLPPGRLAQLKDDVMTQIDHALDGGPDHSTTRQASPIARRRRRRVLALAAAALAGGLGLAGSLVLGGDGTASANTAERTSDDGIVITIREAQHPEELQQRLRDLGVPAVVDFLESGYGCDETRSTGWVEEPRGEDLFAHASSADDWSWVLHPDQLRDGETAVFEFQIDEHGDDLAVSANLRLSTAPVGECVPVPNGSIVDAERGIAGG